MIPPREGPVMPGPPPKHPTTRSRARDAKRAGGDFRVLAVATSVTVPPWPLSSDLGTSALLEVNNDRMASLQVEIESADDRRVAGRLKRELERLELANAKLRLEIEQVADHERELWAELWAMPQAVIWAESHAHREVAQYVRWKIRAESGNLDAGKEARMLSDRLGLNPLALLRLRAEIEQVDKAQEEGQRRRANTEGSPKSKSRKKPDDPRAFLNAAG